ncbi:hypothetical protein FDECE_10106 [Fusarium decemcellulare]|nr:hypothetical protein FDECE_10106 [Fusarium decemcellulare]
MTSSAPTSALVLDFICLFTHDLKRKQKRWQDGVLKYHTFNKRIMVYDDRSHFIGDAHWQEGGDLQPGDEFELDRGSAIVQVSDCTGQREQDLTELLDKRAKEVEKRRTNAGTRTPGSTAAAAHAPRATDQSAHFQLRHRPLTDLVGGSSRIGRAVISPHSPYEARKMSINPGQQQESPSEDARPAKRRKQDESPPSKMGHARSLFGTTLTLTPYTSSNPVARSQALRDRTNVAPNAASTSARTGTSGLPDRAERGSKSPSPLEDLEKAVTDPIPRQPAPRRTLPQRASLRELLGGNGPNLDRPQLKEANHQNHKISVQPSKPRPSLSTNAVASVPVADSGLPKDHSNSNLNRRQTNEPTRRKDAGQPSRPHLSLPKAARVPHPAQEAEQDKDEAFLSWLQSSEDNPANSKVPMHESIPRPSSPCDSARDDVPPDQEPIEIDEEDDEEPPPPPPKATTKRAECTTAKPLTKTKPHQNPKTVGTKRALSSESAPASRTEADDLPPPAKEPRTELRIRSRQRRGLLMISEKQDRGRPTKARVRSAINTVAELESTPEIEARSVAASEEPRATDSRVIHRNLSGNAAQRRDSTSSHVSVSDSDDSSKEKPVTETPCLELNVEALDHTSDEVADHGDAVSVSSTPDDDIPTSPPRRRANPTRRSRRKPPQPVLSDDEDACMDVDSPTEPAPKRKPDPKPSNGPRITKMSRRSVKSREIIGFVVPTDDFPAAAFASMSTNQLNPAEVEKTGGAAEVTRKSHTEGAQYQSVAQPEAQRTVSDESQGRQPPRLINPATRGKKAARREDAAGQPPQTLIQLEPAVPSRIAPPAAPAAPVKRAPSVNDGAQSALPGFTRANGGAWSRHAEDLLGMKRPSRTKPRR